MVVSQFCVFGFFFNDTATTEIYTLSLHDALPISARPDRWRVAPLHDCVPSRPSRSRPQACARSVSGRSEEHTSELQSRQYLVCRLLLEKKKKQNLNLHLTSLCSTTVRFSHDTHCD